MRIQTIIIIANEKKTLIKSVVQSVVLAQIPLQKKQLRGRI